jgi:hypothetical protein
MRETECLTERVNTIKREDGEERREVWRVAARTELR